MLRFGEQGPAMEVQDGVAVVGASCPRPLEQTPCRQRGPALMGDGEQGKG